MPVTATREENDSVSDYAIRIAGMEFAWAADTPEVLRIDELLVRRAERVYLAGPSGSGKSTLLSLIGGITEQDKGTVEVLGTEFSQLPRRRRDRFRADHIGFVFQLFNLLPYLSVDENVALPCRFSPARRQRVEASGGLHLETERLLDALELGSKGLRRRPVTELSIGQQQRVAVARALIGSPALVIADEPTSALDEDTRERFVDLLFQECQSKKITVVFVSHDPRLAPLFDRVLSLPELNRAGSGQAAPAGAALTPAGA
ncbi:MAG: putative ABC transport system ATP-binding protein [Gammaproteobacteria bacterium]|jgi:putative ABC transport system ATP-binding protein